ncbi:ApaG domain-containing protein [Haematococcus lacustris]
MLQHFSSRSARRLHSGTPGRTDTRCRRCVRSRAHKDVMSGVQQRMQLLDGLKDAVSSQDFARAAQMKRQLDELEAEDPILRLRKELKAAIEQEQYKEAARLRTQLCELEAAGDVQPELASLLTTSDTTTHGIRICVRSYFLPAHSLPHKDQWFFGYDVEMTNNSSQVVQLRHRHWVITDEKGETEEVRGPGVVGKQPVLLPRRSFTYSSHCHLRTSQGSMAGTFSFAMLNETDGMFSDPSLAVTVGRFKLSADGGAAL